MSRFRWAVQPGLANFLCDCCNLQCSCPGSGSLPWWPSPSPASPLSCFRQSATGAAAGDCRGRQWPRPPSTTPAAGSGGMAVGPPISGPWPWLGLCLFSGTAPFAAPYSCCKLWWLLPLVRRDRGPLWRSRTGLPVRWGPYKTSQPPSNSFGCQSHCCWAQPRGWKDGAFAGTTRGT